MEPLRASFQQRRWSSFNKANHSSAATLSVHFSVQLLKELLLKVIPICEGVDRLCCQHVVELIWQQPKDAPVIPNDELEETACFLEGLLSPRYEHVEKTLLVDIHSVIGLIRHQQGSLDRAIRSLLLALWLQQKVATTDPVAIAVTEHRLGLVYAKAADYKKASHLIEKALKAYHSADHHKGHVCIAEAEESLSGIRLHKLEEDIEMQRSISDNLAGIMEDDNAIDASANRQQQRRASSRPAAKQRVTPKKHVMRARSA